MGSKARAGFLAAALAAAACSSAGTAPPGDTPPDADAGVTCTAPLAEVGSLCPAIFDGTLASIPCPLYREQHVFPCGDTLVLLEGSGYTQVWCLYDAASHALVGARQTTDYPAYCGGWFGEVAGRPLNLDCVSQTPAAARVCPKSGVDAAPDDGGSARDGADEDADSE